MIDTSFSGLEFQTRVGWSLWNLDSFSYNIGLYLALRIFMLGELSLQLTMSGFDCGFMIYNDPSLVQHTFTSLSRPHCTLKYTFRKLLCLKNNRGQRFSELIKEPKETLKNHPDKLTKTLEELWLGCCRLPWWYLHAFESDGLHRQIVSKWALSKASSMAATSGRPSFDPLDSAYQAACGPGYRTTAGSALLWRAANSTRRWTASDHVGVKSLYPY